jgi:tRNA1(Val) A37 N6-methylase TrmN6
VVYPPTGLAELLTSLRQTAWTEARVFRPSHLKKDASLALIEARKGAVRAQGGTAPIMKAVKGVSDAKAFSRSDAIGTW